MNRPVGVILAAGRGKRMGPLGESYAKTLLPVGNEPLIVHHLALLRSLGVRDVYVIVGHRAVDLVQTLGNGEQYQVHLHYVEQSTPLGIAHALGQLRSVLREPFLLILGDYYFSAVNPERLLQRLREGKSAIAAKHELSRELLSEACELYADRDGRVHKIVEKPAVPSADLKGCGFYAFQPDILDAVSRTPRTALRDEYELSVSLEVYVQTGAPLYAEEVIGWDCNLTRPEDLLECNLQFLYQLNKRELIAADAHIDQGTLLDRVVVGRCCRIERVSSLTDVVIFPGVKLVDSGAIRRAIVTPHHLLNLAQDMLTRKRPASAF